MVKEATLSSQIHHLRLKTSSDVLTCQTNLKEKPWFGSLIWCWVTLTSPKHPHSHSTAPLCHKTAPQPLCHLLQALIHKYIPYRSDTVNKTESAGRAAAVGNIDCGSREALRSERSLPRRMPPFSVESYGQHAKQKCEEKHWPATGKHHYPGSMPNWSQNYV